jgi:hypothetical protein
VKKIRKLRHKGRKKEGRNYDWEAKKKKEDKRQNFSAKSERNPNPIQNNWALESTTATSERRLDMLQRSNIVRLLCMVWKATYL